MEAVVDFEIVTNDDTDESAIKLIALKTIFARQLPKMPREYIVRLVFDRRHVSLAITSGGKIIGGICYRAFKEQKFAEIAFCAISSDRQVKGYGTMLMNQLKVVAQKENLEYFVTYADNFAIGYFQKQGFSKHVSMSKDRWYGYIKDYDGGTLMECYVHPGYPYTAVNDVVNKQRTFFLDRLQEIYPNPPLPHSHDFQQPLESILNAPGVEESGWTLQQISRGATERDRKMSERNATLRALLDRLKAHKLYRQFALSPELMDMKVNLMFIDQRVREGSYYYSIEALAADLMRCCAGMKVRLISAEGQSTLQSFQVMVEELFPKASMEVARTITVS